jgi:hypothetical protein
MSKDIANQEMFIVERHRKMFKFFEAVPEVVKDIIFDLVTEMVHPVAENIFSEAFKEREANIEALRLKRQKSRLRKSFKAWQRLVLKRRSQREILNNFPSIPNFQPIQDQLKANIKASSIKDTLGLRKTVDNLHEIIDLEDRVLEQSILEPLTNLGEILKETGINAWKLIICSGCLNSDSIGKGLVYYSNVRGGGKLRSNFPTERE